jgi:aminoglycoside phosphotransferase family enzyme/gluconate kinase
MTETALPTLIQQMLEPNFYPHAVDGSVRLLQTHTSYVLLTGDYAYKVKKPVNFGFLDYSTLEKRHHFCQEELRLNQRTASELYLDVLPIAAEGDRFQWANEGQPAAEYAVKMQQFPQDTLLTECFERGEFTEARVVELATEIAQFHAGTTTSDYIRAFGDVARVREAFDENYEQTQPFIGGPQTQPQFDETQHYTDRFFEERQALFQQRIDHDRIRECHGDLHLRNICYWRDRLWLFDCIEFNEPFRFVDVMFDIGYIVMDLLVRNRPDLSTLFLNTYVEQTGDWEGLQILPIYVNRQTYVRAKVTSFLLGDPSIPAEEKKSIEETAALYYRLAWELTQPRSGQVIVMAGLSGSGKSTTARQLASRLEAVHLRSDAVRKHLAGIPLNQRGGDELYTPEMSAKTYDRLLTLGITLANDGYTVVLDAKYDRQELRQAAIAQAEAAGLPIHIVYCHAPHDVLKERLQQRTGDIADATVDIMLKQTFEPFTAAEQSHVLDMDTTQEGAIASVLDKLGG